ncbi:hypothetical protein MRX96_053097 [Rhipicephalus microplus]
MLLKLCLVALLVTSHAVTREENPHREKLKPHARDQTEGCCSDMNMISAEELEWGKRMLRNIHLANEAVKKLPKSALYSHDSVCYAKVGCFDRLGGKFSHSASSPKPPEVIGTTFSLYSRLNKDKPVVLDYADKATFNGTHFKKTKELVFVIHGFSASASKKWVLSMKEAFLNLKDVNLVLVDWSKGCKAPNYISAAANSALVGRQVSLLIQKLIRASLTFFQRLDAAGPLFENRDFQDYSASGVPLAMSTFYPNGGKSQPGCCFFDLICHHRRSVQYFIESMDKKRHCLFKSRPCESKDSFLDSKCNRMGPPGEMGYFSRDAKGRGAQFLWTNKNNPFCKA